MKTRFERYAGRKCRIFSPDRKFSTWRKLLALAESQKELGLDISDRQIGAMKEHLYDINYEVAEQREKGAPRCDGTYMRLWRQCPEAELSSILERHPAMSVTTPTLS